MDGDVDLVVSFPDDPLSTVLDGEQATIRVVHTRLDPIQRTAISFASRLAIDQINGQILAADRRGRSGPGQPASDAFSLATGAISSLDQAVSSQDQADADAALDDLEDASCPALAVGAGRRRGLRASRRAIARASHRGRDRRGRRASPDSVDGPARPTCSAQDVNDAPELGSASCSTPVNHRYDQFTSVDPGVLVRPFRSEVELAVRRRRQGHRLVRAGRRHPHAAAVRRGLRCA